MNFKIPKLYTQMSILIFLGFLKAVNMNHLVIITKNLIFQTKVS